MTVLEWDQSGRNLLIGDSSGVAEMWTSLTHLIDEWTRVAEICIPNEPIQTGTFLYNGKRVYHFDVSGSFIINKLYSNLFPDNG